MRLISYRGDFHQSIFAVLRAGGLWADFGATLRSKSPTFPHRGLPPFIPVLKRRGPVSSRNRHATHSQRTHPQTPHSIAAAGDLSADTKNPAPSLTLATCAISRQAKTARCASSSVAERKYDGHGTKSALPGLALEFCNFRNIQGSS